MSHAQDTPGAQDVPSTSGLPPGVTRYAIARAGTWRPPARSVTVALGGFFLMLGLTPLTLGGPPAPVLLTLAAAWAVPPATVPLPRLARLVVAVLALVTLVIVVAEPEGGESAALLALLAGIPLGIVTLLPLLARRERRERLATAVGAPAHDVDPRGGVDVGTLATWRDADHEYDAPEPAVEVVLDAVRRLGGSEHHAVSIYRGKGRLDVYGHHVEELVVQQSDRRVGTRGWWIAIDPAHAPNGSSGMSVPVGYRGHHVDRGRTVGLAQAEGAVRAWLGSGVRDSALTWHLTGLRDNHARPSTLRRTD